MSYAEQPEWQALLYSKQVLRSQPDGCRQWETVIEKSPPNVATVLSLHSDLAGVLSLDDRRRVVPLREPPTREQDRVPGLCYPRPWDARGDVERDRVISISRKAVTLGSPEWHDVERLIAAGLVSDIALDTLARVAHGETNSEAEQVAHFAAVAKAIERAPSVETRPTACVLAHTRKGDASALEDAGGSMQRVRAERRSSGQVIASTVRPSLTSQHCTPF